MSKRDFFYLNNLNYYYYYYYSYNYSKCKTTMKLTKQCCVFIILQYSEEFRVKMFVE